MPPALSSSPPTPKHTEKQQRYRRNQFFFLLRVRDRDSHRHYGPQPFRQSSRKVSSNTKFFHLVFGFTFFSLVMDCSRVLFKPSRPQFQYHMCFFFHEFHLMFIKLYSLIEVISSSFFFGFKSSVTSTFEYMKSLWCTSQNQSFSLCMCVYFKALIRISECQTA